MPWKYPRVELPPEEAPPAWAEAVAEQEELLEVQPALSRPPAGEAPALRLPWASLLALLLALAGQFSLGPAPERDWRAGAALLLLSLALAAWSAQRGEWQLAVPPAEQLPDALPRLRPSDLLIGLGLSALAFLAFYTLQFGVINTALLAAGVYFIARAFWQPTGWLSRWSARGRAFLADPQLTLRFSGWTLAWAAALAVVLFFRFYRLGDVPPEMNSDHAEKLLDILRVLNGERLIFFASNGGREALIFYLGAALHRLTGLSLGFMSLKLVSALIGLAALPFLYGIGVELGNRRVGLLAFTLAGIAYWTNVVSRFGLRLPFYFLFTAAVMYFVLRGLRRGSINQFVLAGVALGIGLYGYTADRILPLLVAVAIGLHLLHRRSRPAWGFALSGLLAAALLSFALFLPMLRYLLAEPDAFLLRTLSRMGSLERPLESPAWLILLQNTGRALAMFSWDAGEIWPISIPGYPALGVAAGALFYLGAALALLRYLRTRRWQDLFLLLAIPILQIPSTLALAFPTENPNLYRTGGAMVPVFLLVALALDGLMAALEKSLPAPNGRLAAATVMLWLIFMAGAQDYVWTFERYYQYYRNSAWNTSEIGAVARQFAETIGSPDTVWVVGFPHWVDSRLVATNAGFPGRDFRLYPEQIEATLFDPRPKLFLLNPQDEQGLQALRLAYPQGWSQTIVSKTPTKDFVVFFVPPTSQP
jgi:hypothetical protein